MTTESILDQYRRVERELREGAKPEPTLDALLAREEARLGNGIKLIPKKGNE